MEYNSLTIHTHPVSMAFGIKSVLRSPNPCAEGSAVRLRPVLALSSTWVQDQTSVSAHWAEATAATRFPENGPGRRSSLSVFFSVSSPLQTVQVFLTSFFSRMILTVPMQQVINFLWQQSWRGSCGYCLVTLTSQDLRLCQLLDGAPASSEISELS